MDEGGGLDRCRAVRRWFGVSAPWRRHKLLQAKQSSRSGVESARELLAFGEGDILTQQGRTAPWLWWWTLHRLQHRLQHEAGPCLTLHSTDASRGT